MRCDACGPACTLQRPVRVPFGLQRLPHSQLIAIVRRRHCGRSGGPRAAGCVAAHSPQHPPPPASIPPTILLSHHIVRCAYCVSSRPAPRPVFHPAGSRGRRSTTSRSRQTGRTACVSSHASAAPSSCGWCAARAPACVLFLVLDLHMLLLETGGAAAARAHSPQRAPPARPTPSRAHASHHLSRCLGSGIILLMRMIVLFLCSPGRRAHAQEVRHRGRPSHRAVRLPG